MKSLTHWPLVLLFALAGCLYVGCGPVDVSSSDDRATPMQQNEESVAELAEVQQSGPPLKFSLEYDFRR